MSLSNVATVANVDFEQSVSLRAKGPAMADVAPGKDSVEDDEELSKPLAVDVLRKRVAETIYFVANTTEQTQNKGKEQKYSGFRLQSGFSPTHPHSGRGSPDRVRRRRRRG